jgi:DNA repair protein RecN (Recombination protein N)
MLKHLRITNFAILSDVAIDLGPGFNVLTGETGAGKSLIVDAVALLRGARASADIPRAGADEAVVEALFEAPEDLAPQVAARLEALGLRPGDDGELLVRRVISRGGRSRVHVNGGLTTAAALAELGGILVELAGQHEHQGLVNSAGHADILDAFGVDARLLAAMAAAHERLSAAATAHAELSGDDRQRAQREDFLRFQLEELTAAKPRAGEEATLGAERERLRAASKLTGTARKAEEQLYASDGAVTDVLAALRRELDALVAIDPKLGEPARQLAESHAMIEDAARALGRYADGLAADPERLGELEDRLHLLTKLCRKHGVASAAELAAAQAAMSQELSALGQHESHLAERERELEAARKAAAQAATALTAARKQSAGKLERAAGAALAELGMKGARVEVAISSRDADQIGRRGWDRIELLLAANKGEPARPLAKIASGGELSRIMLAIKLALQRADAVGTYVFDEVDAGIGGGVAEVVGRQIQRVAHHRQVICVTHLAQIAALADTQFRVEKSEKDGRVETTVTRLSASERREELARMLGGLKITAKARAHADELLKQSRELRAN